MTTYHLCIPVKRGLDDLAKGKNYLDCTPLEAFHLYQTALEEGKTFYSGCSNEDSEGRCNGHDDV